MSAENPAGAERVDRTEPSLRFILIAAGGLALGVAVTLAIAAIVYHAGRPGGAAAARNGRFQDGPEQRTSVEADQAQVRKDAQAHLESYGWVDRPAGVVRIPIERAMEIEAAKEGAK